jgi:4-amino-4-deoxy-L-arabinose transferase-like glycosyltransferase
MTRDHAPDVARTHRLSWRKLVLLTIILLLALALRLWHLDEHVLWWDEGNNAYFAQTTPSQLLEMSRLTNDTDPPVHRLALGLWFRMLGASAYNLRLLSVVCGALTVGLAFLWGRRLGGDRVGLLAALLLALSPTAIYYSREAKGYPWITLFEWIGLSLFYSATDDRSAPRSRGAAFGLWAAYVAASVLAVGAHYFALFVHLAQGVWLLAAVARPWTGWRKAWRRVWPWTLAQVAVLAAVAPWVMLTWRTAYAGADAIPLERGGQSLARYLTAMATQLAAGKNPEILWGTVAALALLVPAAWAIWAGRRDEGRRLYGLLACMVLVPLSAGYLVQRVSVIVIPRLFLFVVPALCVLAAAGLARLRWRALPVGLALALASGISLPGAYASPALPGEDIRQLGATLDALARPGDLVVVNYIWEEGLLRLYAPHAEVEWRLGWYTDENVSAEMASLLSAYERLWLVSYRQPLQHPSNQAGWWLEQHVVRVLAQEQGNTRLVLYVPGCEGKDSIAEYRFDHGVTLHSAGAPEMAEPGDVLSLALSWTAAQPVADGITAFVQLIGPDGALVAQSDGDPLNGLAPLSTLTVGTPLQDCRALLVPPDAAPGLYTVIAGLYDRTTGTRLTVTAGDGTADHAVLGTVQIQWNQVSQ